MNDLISFYELKDCTYSIDCYLALKDIRTGFDHRKLKVLRLNENI